MNNPLLFIFSLLLCGSTVLHAAGGKPESADTDALSKKRSPKNLDRQTLHFHGLGGYDVLLVRDGERQNSWINLLWHGRAIDLYDTTRESAAYIGRTVR